MHRIFTLLFACTAIVSHGQEFATLKEPAGIDFQKQFLSLKGELVKRDSLEWIKTQYSVLRVLENSKELELDFENVVDKIEEKKVFTDLMKANNPVDNILGASFSDVIAKATEKHFLSALTAAPNDKVRFSDIVNKIIKNPIISTILNSNPITGVVASITNAASGFFTTTLGRNGKDLFIETKNVFEQTKIDAFNRELSPYIEFYDKMLKSTNKYQVSVQNLKDKYAYLDKSVSNYKERYLRTLDIKKSDVPNVVQAYKLFEPTKDEFGFLRYHEVVTQPNIVGGMKIATEFDALRSQVDNFKADYNAVLKAFLLDMKSHLDEQKSRAAAQGLSTGRLMDITGQITTYIKAMDIKKGSGNADLRTVEINVF